MPLSNYTRELLAKQLVDISDWGGPGDVYVGLFTDDPGPSGDSNEVTNSEYDRQLIGWQRDGVIIENASSVSFPEATSDWGTVTHFAAFDAQTGGNQLFSGKLRNERTIVSGNVPTIPAGGMPARIGYSTETVQTVQDWNNLPADPSDGEVVMFSGDLDNFYLQYDESLRTSEVGEGRWRLVSYKETARLRKLPLGDGEGNLHPMWEPDFNQGVLYSSNKAFAKLEDNGNVQRLHAYSKFYLPLKPVVMGRGNIGGLVPSDFNESGVQIGVGVRDPYEDSNIGGQFESWISTGDGGAYGDTTSRTIPTSGGSAGFTDLNDKTADHLLEAEMQHEGGNGAEWGRVRDLANNNNLRVDEYSSETTRTIGGRVYILLGEYTSNTDYASTPPDVTLRDIEVFA